MADPSFVSKEQTTATAVTSVTINKPAGVVEGDELFAQVDCDAASQTLVTADGTAWTAFDNDGSNGFSSGIVRRRAGASEPSTYSFKRNDDGSDNFAVSVSAWRGIDETYPIDDGEAVTIVAAGTSIATAAVNIPMKNTMVLAFVSIGANTTLSATPSGYTQALDNDGFNPGHALFYKLQTSVGSSGTQSWTVGSSTALKGRNVPLRPAGDKFSVSVQHDSRAVTDNAGSAVTWANINNVQTSNGTYTGGTASGTTASDFLDLLDWDFNIPSGATPVGVVMIMEQRRSGGATGQIIDNLVEMRLSGGSISSNMARSTNWATFDMRQTYGDRDDLWGATLTDTDVNDATFGFRIAVQGAAAGADRNFNVDHVFAYIIYTEAGDDLVEVVDELVEVHASEVRMRAMSRIATHQVSELHETAARAMAMARAVNDLSEIHETVDRSIGLIKQIDSLMEIHESIARSIALVRITDNVEQGHESLARARALVRTRDDLAEIHESIDTLKSLLQVTDELSQVHETKVRSMAMSRISNSLQEIHDSIVRARVMARVRNESSDIHESISKTGTLLRQATDVINSLETLASVRGRAVTADDLSQILETSAKAKAISISISNMINVLDSIVKAMTLVRPHTSVSENDDNIVRSRTTVRLRNELSEVHETSVVSRVLLRLIDDLNQTLETFVRNFDLNRVNDSLSIKLEDQSRSMTKARATNSTSNVVDTFAIALVSSTLLLLRIGEAVSFLAMRVGAPEE